MFIQRILVATDFSLRSRAALRYAEGIAGATGATIDVLHVTPAPGVLHTAFDAYLGRAVPTVGDQILWEAEKQLNLFVSAVLFGPRNVTPLLESGDPAATIVRVAVERRADLVVLGTHARTGVAEMLLGSVAHRVITCAPCPVVTMRGDESAAKALATSAG
jgi:nucleotide-binding universal stress UspA family protein